MLKVSKSLKGQKFCSSSNKMNKKNNYKKLTYLIIFLFLLDHVFCVPWCNVLVLVFKHSADYWVALRRPFESVVVLKRTFTAVLLKVSSRGSCSKSNVAVVWAMITAEGTGLAAE